MLKDPLFCIHQIPYISLVWARINFLLNIDSFLFKWNHKAQSFKPAAKWVQTRRDWVWWPAARICKISQRHSERISVRFSFFASYTRRKNATNTTLCEILRHFCGSAICGVLVAQFGQNLDTKGGAKGGATVQNLRCLKHATKYHEVSCLRHLCGIYKSKKASKAPKIHFLRLTVVGIFKGLTWIYCTELSEFSLPKKSS